MSSRRSAGINGANPISMSDILAYAEVFEVDDLERFISHIISMDTALLTFISNRQKAQRDG